MDPIRDQTARRRVLESLKSRIKELRWERRGQCPKGKISFKDIATPELREVLNGKTFSILCVGIAGCGKSSVFNTALAQYRCPVGRPSQHNPGTVGLEEFRFPIDLGENCSFNVVLWDTRGFSGRDSEEDKQLRRDIADRVGRPDLTLVCSDITAFGGRRNAIIHDNFIEQLKEIQDGALFENCMIIVTMCDQFAVQTEKWKRQTMPNLSPSDPVPEEEWHHIIEEGIENWVEMWGEVLSQTGIDPDPIPVIKYGHIRFESCRDSVKTPVHIGSIGPYRTRWLHETWTKLKCRLLPLDIIALFMLLNLQFPENPHIPLHLQPKHQTGHIANLCHAQKIWLLGGYCLSTLAGGLACSAWKTALMGVAMVNSLYMAAVAGTLAYSSRSWIGRSLGLPWRCVLALTGSGLLAAAWKLRKQVTFDFWPFNPIYRGTATALATVGTILTLRRFRHDMRVANKKQDELRTAAVADQCLAHIETYLDGQL